AKLSVATVAVVGLVWILHSQTEQNAIHLEGIREQRSDHMELVQEIMIKQAENQEVLIKLVEEIARSKAKD
ncbi:unnamed protein product, partial [marine sediment metagenome]